MAEVTEESENVENVNPLDGLTKPWQKFFQKFDEIETLKVSQWKEVHLLAHICKRYEQLYKIKFAVTIKNAPTKSPDIYMVKRILAMLNTTDMKQAKDYIDWVYDSIIIPKRTKFKKIGFFVTSGYVNDFQLSRRKKQEEITRSMEVPPTYKSIATELGVSIKTYGDLAFIKMAVDRNKDASSPHAVLLGNLELLGLNLEKLKELK